MTTRAIKTKVASNLGANYASRFFNTLWTYRLCQLTTSKVGKMKDTGIAMEMSSSHSEVEKKENTPVKSDLQPHSLFRFNGDKENSILVAIPKDSEHYRHLLDCKRCSVMVGHTDPQIFHWFKQLGTLPPRAVVSGAAELLSGDLKAEAWEKSFVNHPVIHRIAQDMWEDQKSQTPEEKVHIATREKEEDDKRMRRMSSSDWRSKFCERERNPTREEDEEKPIYVLKPNTFVVARVRPEGALWMDAGGGVKRVWDPPNSDAPPLCRCSHRFIKMLNLAREKLVASLNMNYNLKLTNCFVFDVDEDGLWAMGSQENFAEKNGVVREKWVELQLEFGKGQKIKTEQELEWWIRGLTKLGAPEVTQTNSSIEDAGLNPEDYDYRHI